MARARGLAFSLALVVSLAPLPSPAATAATAAIDPAAGHWEGSLAIPGMPLGVAIDLARDGGQWGGTIDIPAQGARGLPLEAVTVRGDSVSFRIARVPGEPTFRGALADSAGTQRLAGTFSQSGQRFPLAFGRGPAAQLRRPQDPRPPLPYRSEDVAYDSGAVRLAATLTLPEGRGPFPAAVLITGSGAQNRDEELFGHRYFLVLADHLTRAGIAVLRADDRGVGGSTGSVANSTTADFADDALAGIAYLRARPEVDGARIGLVGHSEGGIVAPLAAAREPGKVAFVVMLAGTGVPLDEVILRQMELLSTAAGVPAAQVAEEVARARTAMAAIKAGADSVTVRAGLQALVESQLAARPTPGAAADVAGIVDGALAGMTSPWFRYAISLDPRVALRQVRCPVLAVNGSLDLQVDPRQNLPEIEKALREGGNADVTIRELPGLCHTLQAATVGLPQEYGLVEETMNPVALDLVSGWIRERMASGD